QVLFHFCVVAPSALGQRFSLPLHLITFLFWLLCLSSVLIAGAGYIINDYFDINIDQINKPDKMVLERTISRRAAILWHLVLSVLGVLLGAFISYKLNNWLIAPANLLCVMLLWIYSTTYKRKLLVGNLLISALTAWVILVLLAAELPGWWGGALTEPLEVASAARLTRIAMLYAGFAFIISLVREVVKDVEDIEGDRRLGCRTMPIVWGINASKIFAGTWLAILMVLLVITQVYVLQFGWWWSSLYIVALVVIPLGFIFKQLMQATLTQHFTQLSRHIKWVMLSGILSMIFFLTYTQ
ncbi:MAG TPA: geranylgeranylglycerol-phosphate geranylgeranyltransferase, partial [Phnomibacter sp.]|nr:geranylgeranylglycerol-phosphate geranylgeranyltransferase [Phnomibacter sp.]